MKNKSWFGRLAALVAVLALAVAAGFPTAAMATTAANTIAATQNLDGTTAAANRWQVVSGEYEGNQASNKTTFKGHPVRAQKNVVATDKENEFLIYESIDIRQKWVEDYKQFFERATYEATTSANYHGEPAGTVVHSMTGNEKVLVSGDSSKGYPNSALFTILAPDGTTVLADNVRIYWSQANNVTFYLKVNDKNYILMGAKIGNNSTDNTIVLSEDAEELIKEELVNSQVSNLVNLTNVTDEMGPNITYVETVSCNGSTSFANGTLTWTPTLKSNPTIVKDGDGTTSDDGNGNITKTGYRWATNVAELVYRVRLTPEVSTGLNESDNSLPDTSANPPVPENAFTNGKATVNWEGGSGELTSPVVRGMLYEIKFKKTDDATPAKALKDAEFTLYSDEGCTQVVDTARSVIKEGEEDAYVDFTNLQCGTYYLKETKAPSGYEAEKETVTDENGEVQTRDKVYEYKLCYTDEDSRGILTGQNTADTPNEEALAGKVNGEFTTIRNKNVIEFSLLKVNELVDSKVLAGAEFVLYRDDGNRVFSKEADKPTDFTGTTDDDGRIKFSGLDCDTDDADATYWIVEEKAPDGYALPDYTKVAPTYVSIRVDEDGRLTIVETNATKTDTGTYDVKDADGKTLRTIPSVTVKDRPRAVRVLKDDGNGNALQGAEFTLYTDKDCTIEATGLYSDAALNTSTSATRATGGNGAITWYGLSAATYYLKETKVPAGHQIYDQVVKLEVAPDGSVKATMDANGDGTTETAALNVDDADHGLSGVDDKVPYLAVSDPANPDMPTTGSSGRLVLTILGVGLIAGGAALVAWLRRRGGSVAAR